MSRCETGCTCYGSSGQARTLALRLIIRIRRVLVGFELKGLLDLEVDLMARFCASFA